jgi:mRNA export factor
LGSIEGRVAIQYIEPKSPKDNFTFKCHRSQPSQPNQPQDIYAVNDIAFHPQYMTLATVGSDGKFSFWDKDNRFVEILKYVLSIYCCFFFVLRTKLKSPELPGDTPITCCTIDSRGKIFAYAIGYDWHKVRGKVIEYFVLYFFFVLGT